MLVFSTPAPGVPCSWDVDPSCCSTWSTYTPALQQAAAEFGAAVVWAATGRRFGLCRRTVRPCGRTKSNDGGVFGYYWSDGTWAPYILNGAWRNCWCGAMSPTPGCCSCEPDCQVLLPAPAYSIPVTGVSVDGAVVPASSYRIDNGKWLVRTDGLCWPDCTDFNVDSGVGVFEVTYDMGLPVPAPLLVAAGTLACEFAKACSGAPCRLPTRMSSVTRQGVSMSAVSIDDLMKRGLTGLPDVDLMIRTFNPYGLVSASTIASPDLPVTRVVTYP